jgi:type IX secretion system PorP/SprF family membrane protein
MKKLSFRICLGKVVGLCLLLNFAGHAQQEAMYSQYVLNPLAINPAYAGSREHTTITAIYRRQWLAGGFEGDPQTQTISVDVPLNERVGLGVQFFNDGAGVIRSTGGYGIYAYKIPLADGATTLSLGLQLGFTNFRADLTSVNTGGTIDPNFSQNINRFLFSAGTGVYLSSDRWYVGVSCPQILKNKLGVFDNPNATQGSFENRYFFGTAGYVFDLNSSVKLKPAIVTKFVEGAPLSADILMNFWIAEKIGIGGAYRFLDSSFTEATGQTRLAGGWMGMAEVQVAPRWRLGYVFTQNFIGQNNLGNNAHELMLQYRLVDSDRPMQKYF